MHLEITGFSFPNDLHILWSLMIVMYPYITGLVAGAFIVSSLYHVFGREELKPVSRLAMVASLAFLLVAPLPLLNHLGRPERALNIMITPNFSSAMAAFGMIYTIYLIIVAFEIWLLHRKEIILTARRSRGIKRWLFAAAALGTYNISDEALELDRKIIRVLAAVGIPAACILHGYVGFMFGSVKANVWWSTPLMPIIFLFSAVTSGVAIIIVLYQIITKISSRRINGPCMQSLAEWLWFFTIITISLELLEIITLAYERNEEWMVIAPLLSSKLAFSFIGVQLVFGSLIPILLLGVVVLLRSYLTDPLRNTITLSASIILLIQVLAMRWNVVIGGQIFSKSLVGFRENYSPGLFEKEGIAAAIIIFVAPFIFMALFNHFLPLHDNDEREGAPALSDAGAVRSGSDNG